MTLATALRFTREACGYSSATKKPNNNAFVEAIVDDRASQLHLLAGQQRRTEDFSFMLVGYRAQRRLEPDTGAKNSFRQFKLYRKQSEQSMVLWVFSG